MELQSETAASHITDDFGAHLLAETQLAANPRFFRRIDQSDPESSPGSGKRSSSKHLDLPAAFLRAAQPRRKNFRIVEDQEISGIEKLAELGKYAMNNFAGVARCSTSKRDRFARAAWIGSDQRFRQFIVKFLEIHGRNKIRARHAVPLRDYPAKMNWRVWRSRSL